MTRVSPDGKTIQVAIGSFKTTLQRSEMRKTGTASRQGKVSRDVSSAGQVSPTLDIRGFKYEVALEKIRGYLDQAGLAGLRHVSIIHGKGTGALRTATEEALKKHTPSLMSLTGVVGTGQGLRDGSPCITVFVIRKTPELERKIPRELEGFPVKIEDTGRVDALPATPRPPA